jgi:hypothetical protein
MPNSEGLVDEAIRYFDEQRKKEQVTKHLATLKRITASGSDSSAPYSAASDADEMYRKLAEAARGQNLRRTGS